MFDRVPRNPLSADDRQGNTLGRTHRHWFRAKFGAHRFRLFFRADTASHTIIHAWVNDRDTLRKSGAASDPYTLFSTMLASGDPPHDWPGLLAAAEDPVTMRRFTGLMTKP